MKNLLRKLRYLSRYFNLSYYYRYYTSNIKLSLIRVYLILNSNYYYRYR